MSKSIAQILAEARTRTSWNDRFEHWERPASDSEEAVIERAATMIRNALVTNAWLTGQGVTVKPQGSYHNNTNVRLESDMDLGIRHHSIMMITGPGVTHQQADVALGMYPTGASNPHIAATLRAEIGAALIDEFGEENVHPGTKAFTVGAIPNSRADADVVPMLRMTYAYLNQPLFGTPHIAQVDGVVIYGTDGREIMNFPDQHAANGKTKRENTAHRFKKNVRILKRLRDELVEMKWIEKGVVPSFLIECLCYRVEDAYYLVEEDRYDRVVRILGRMGALLNDQTFVNTANEINDIKFLFHQSQPWTPAAARFFVATALTRLAAN